MSLAHTPLPPQDPATCTACAAARLGPSGMYFSNCDGCVARQIATSQEAYVALAVGGDSGPLKEMGRKMFPPDRRAWAVGAIKDWFNVLQTWGRA